MTRTEAFGVPTSLSNKLLTDTFIGTTIESLSATTRSFTLTASTKFAVNDHIEIGASFSITIPATSSLEIIANDSANNVMSLTNKTLVNPIWDGWSVVTADGWTWSGATLAQLGGSSTNSPYNINNYAVGDKVKMYQLSVTNVPLYFVITSINTATGFLGLTGGSDYAFTNAAVSSVYISHQASPVGFPGEFAYAPVWTSTGSNPTLGNGVLTGAFSMVGKTVSFRFNLTLGTTTSTTGATGFIFSLPTTATANLGLGTNVAVWYGENPGVQGYMGVARLVGTTTISLDHHSLSVAGGAIQTSATTPATWASTWFIRLQGSYQNA